ncbi:hypothetical protein TPHA_0J00280 [Tetrapisispora phaffii CBS 4417]|uniref:U three protein 23 n=1 Tax=Tetrapisispora phaffii (strain ATCC 24235 / CBS 4417 / NBRC 1672 / NRRL Y-8282 / UCD 70-5) TaxID=1071381 RepID=G8BYB0_TETPH|nr:hypothetical protein TPHA_0J00280 [Tetrapisispora phaffii CBS 4417]CCE64852.1 hypothetical protein TPHA_0J00280 [Tetrapisispora phaffii CBS 4417]
MRQKRAKSYKKQMVVYNHTFKFREPYQILVDEQIVQDSFESNYNLYRNLRKTLQAENIKVMITQCCMQKLYTTSNQELIDEAKRFERRRCNHSIKDPKEPLECIESIVNIDGQNKHRYVVATQNMELRRKLRRVPGVPILHLSRSVMIMEPISDSSVRLNRKFEQSKLYKGLNDPKYSMAPTPKEGTPDTEGTQPAATKKRKGVKEPNPLSKKKKVKVEIPKPAATTTDAANKKRRRKHRSNKNSENGNEGEDPKETGNSEEQVPESQDAN